MGTLSAADLKNAILQEMERGRIPESMRLLQQLQAMEPGDPAVYYLLGIGYIHRQDLERARECLNRSVELDPAFRQAFDLLEDLKHRGGDITLHTPSIQGKPLKKKECPKCHLPVWTGNFRCPHCGALYVRKMLRQGLLFLVASVFLLLGLRIGLAYVFGTVERPAAVVNAAGETENVLAVTDTRWFSAGFGIGRAGYTGELSGTIKNAGIVEIEKANLTVRFWNENLEMAFIWFDLLNLPPGYDMDFIFPNILPQNRADRCEIRVESLKLASAPLKAEDLPEVYVPSSEQFPFYAFRHDGSMVACASAYARELEKPSSWTASNIAHFFLYLFLSWLAAFVSVLTINYCDPETRWNENWPVEAAASLGLAVGIVAVNLFVVVFGIVPGIGFLFRMAGILLQFYLFFIFYQRETLQTICLIILYYSYNALLRAAYLAIEPRFTG